MGNRSFLLFFLFAASAVDAQYCLGPGDFDADHKVTSVDTSLFVQCLGGPAFVSNIYCPPNRASSADLDGDGDNDLADVAAYSLRFGMAYFDYGPERENKEAEYHAITLTGELRAPQLEYMRISRDLELIRQRFPELMDVRHEGSAPYTDLIVRLHSAGDRADFDNLNQYFGFTSSRLLFGDDLFYVEYCDALYPVALAEIYKQSDEVESAHGNLLGCIPGCCWNRVQVGRVGDIFTYDFSFSYSEPEPYTSCGCWRRRILDVDTTGQIVQVICEDGCLSECP